MQAFVSWLWIGSSASKVTSVEVADAPADALNARTGFFTLEMDCMHNRCTVSAIVSALALLCSTPYPAAAQELPTPVAAAPSTPR